MIALIGPNGRLGNRLWTYANVLAFSMEHQIRVVNPKFREFAYFAEETSDARLNRLLTPSRASLVTGAAARAIYKFNLRMHLYPSIQLGDDRLLELDDEPEFASAFGKSQWVFLYGLYFAAPESMRKQRSHLLEFFALLPPWRSRVDRQLAIVRAQCDVAVGIHLRKGDKRSYVGGIMYYSEEDIADAMHHVADQLAPRRVCFLICSDEPINTRAFGELNVVVAENEAIVDMYALAGCDYLLGPNSSFSQWASFFANVPIHIVDWKAAEKYGTGPSIRRPSLETDFRVFAPRAFARYHEKQLFARDVLAPLSAKLGSPPKRAR